MVSASLTQVHDAVEGISPSEGSVSLCKKKKRHDLHPGDANYSARVLYHARLCGPPVSIV